jgi:hypothetical protein
MCSVRFIQWFLTKIIKEKTGDLKFRSEWTGFRFTQCPVSSGFTVYDSCLTTNEGPLWSWSYVSWIYNYLCNQCLSPLKLWVRILLRRDLLDTTLCDKVCQWLVTGRWFPADSSTNKTDRYDITEILLKVALSTKTLTLTTNARFFQRGCTRQRRN